MFEGLDTEQKAVSIPYYVHEGEMARVERLNKRWFIAFLIVLLMLFASNIGWLTAGIRPKSGLYSTRQWTHYKL